MIIYFSFVIYALIIQFDGYEYQTFLAAIIVLIFCWPALTLHYNYCTKTEHISLVFHEKFIEIFQKDNLEFKVYKYEVLKMTIFMSLQLIENRATGKFPSLACSYMEIETLNSKIVINNLIYLDLKNLASSYFDIKPQYQQTLFAYIK